MIKIILVPVTPVAGTLVVTTNKVMFCEKVEQDHCIVRDITGSATTLKYYGPTYTMVGYNPTAEEEEDMFLPLAPDQWRLCTKYIPRNENLTFKTKLSEKGKLHPHQWVKATLRDGQYKVYQPVE